MMKWLGILSARTRSALELAPPPAQPQLTALGRVAGAMDAPPRLVAIATADPANQVSERDARIVRDVAGHVASKVVPIVELHGRTMENALQANVMAIEVALHLALEAAQRTALTEVLRGGSLEDALAKLEAALITIHEGLDDHRPALVAAIEATHAGIIGGQLRQ